MTGTERVNLEEMLSARERRAGIQAEMNRETGLPLISMTLNVPGDIKRTGLTAFFFYRELNLVRSSLAGLGARIVSVVQNHDKTGDEAVLAVQGLSAAALKRLAVSLEERRGASRLLDIDVLDERLVPQHRSDLGAAPRRCLLCGRPVLECGPARAHTAEALSAEAFRRIEGAVSVDLADDLSAMAAEAASFELMVSGKPGLVTLAGSGSHTDMDRFTFGRALAVLAPWYREAFLAGWSMDPGMAGDMAVRWGEAQGEEGRFSGKAGKESRTRQGGARKNVRPDGCDQDASAPAKAAAASLRLKGILADREMLRATGGVNTHRGWIYMSGVLLSAMGFLIRFFLDPERFQFPEAFSAVEAAQGMCAADDGFDVFSLRPGREGLKAALSHCTARYAALLDAAATGSPLFVNISRDYLSQGNPRGVRGEALAGFPSIMRVGLPVMESACASSGSVPNDDAVGRRTFLALLGVVRDTTTAKRGSEMEAEDLRKALAECFTGCPEPVCEQWTSRLCQISDSEIARCLEELGHAFSGKRLTAGGTADALAGTRLVKSFLDDVTNVLLFSV